MDNAFGLLAERVAGSLSSEPPHLIGVSGAVAVGKSTVAQELAREMSNRGFSARVVATDAFLLPNKVLSERGLTYKKGFPESFDLELLIGFLRRVKAGEQGITIPVYSHVIYDVVTGEAESIDTGDVIVLEGVIALQEPVATMLDLAIYIDAAEEDVRSWFVTRFNDLTEAARDDPSAFYHAFAGMASDEIEAVAHGAWDHINAVNLRDHIAPSRANAHIVVSKAADHSVRSIS